MSNWRCNRRRPIISATLLSDPPTLPSPAYSRIGSFRGGEGGKCLIRKGRTIQERIFHVVVPCRFSGRPRPSASSIYMYDNVAVARRTPPVNRPMYACAKTMNTSALDNPV